MMRMLMALCLVLAGYATLVAWRCWLGPPHFTDLIGQKSAPDGTVVASYVVQNYGPTQGTVFGLTLAGKNENPLRAEPILVEGEDDRAIEYDWLSNTAIAVQLPCGWWKLLTNHYQLNETGQIIDVTYLPPPVDCPQKHTKSTSLPD